MGNVLRLLYGYYCYSKGSTTGTSESPSHGVSALAHHLFHFDITSQIPEGISNHVTSSKKVQADWYRRLLEAWRESKPPPKTAEEASRLIIETLKTIQKPDIEVDAKAVQDGDSVTVYVSTADPWESSNVPPQVNLAAVKRSKACTKKNYDKADALHEKIISAGYRLSMSYFPNNSFFVRLTLKLKNTCTEEFCLIVIRVLKIQDEEILARKCRIRLRGIDAPERYMPYGDEAKEELTKLMQGKCLRILVYGEDQYGRSVGDIYCNGTFVQEVLLKRGCAWHYVHYDKRPEFARWEKEARSKRMGLWAAPNPEKPWDWRKNNPRTSRSLSGRGPRK